MLETQIMMLGQFGKLERAFISARTKEGLVNAQAKGKILGRPIGSIAVRYLDRKANIIIDCLKKGLAKTQICKLIGEQEEGVIKPVPVVTFDSWLKRWKIDYRSPWKEKLFPELEQRKAQLTHLENKLAEIVRFIREMEQVKGEKGDRK